MTTPSIKPILIAADGTVTNLAPALASKGLDLRDYQKAVGGYVEPVRLGNMLLMLVNEEGLLRRLPYNHTASRIAGRGIVGPAVVTASEDFQ